MLVRIMSLAVLLGMAHQASVTVRKGERVVLPCPVKVEARNYAVTWWKGGGGGGARGKSELILFDKSSRLQLGEDRASLVISTATAGDTGHYSCRVVLPQRPEMVDSVELTVLAPPSAPQLFLQVPSNPAVNAWHLQCVTKGFYPARVTLRWTWRSPAAATVTCSLGVLNQQNASQTTAESNQTADCDPSSPANPHQLHCFGSADTPHPEMQLTSVLSLPFQSAITSDIDLTCTVEGHPALDASLSTSFTWESSLAQVTGCVNVLKMVVLSGIGVVLVTLGVCARRPNYSERKSGRRLLS